jgi:hypothetical protein
MKRLIWALVLMPVLACGQVYRYDNVLCFESPGDGFNFNSTACISVKNGYVKLDNERLVIDKNSYPLKATRKEHYYKSRHCSVKLVYEKEALKKIMVYRYNSRMVYYLKPAETKSQDLTANVSVD